MTIVLVILAALALWFVSLLVKPTGKCFWCGGDGRRHQRRIRLCRHCRGTGRRFRFGARQAHRVVVAGVRAIRERGNH